MSSPTVADADAVLALAVGDPQFCSPTSCAERPGAQCALAQPSRCASCSSLARRARWRRRRRSGARRCRRARRRLVEQGRSRSAPSAPRRRDGGGDDEAAGARRAALHVAAQRVLLVAAPAAAGLHRCLLLDADSLGADARGARACAAGDGGALKCAELLSGAAGAAARALAQLRLHAGLRGDRAGFSSSAAGDSLWRPPPSASAEAAVAALNDDQQKAVAGVRGELTTVSAPPASGQARSWRRRASRACRRARALARGAAGRRLDRSGAEAAASARLSSPAAAGERRPAARTGWPTRGGDAAVAAAEA